MKEIVVDAIDNDLPLSEVFRASHAVVVWCRRLVYGPVVEWRIDHWVLELGERFVASMVFLIVVLVMLLLMLLKMKWNLLISGQESVESWHSCCFNLSFLVYIKVIPCLVKVFLHV